MSKKRPAKLPREGKFFFARYFRRERLDPGELPLLVLVIIDPSGITLWQADIEFAKNFYNALAKPALGGFPDDSTLWKEQTLTKQYLKADYTFKWNYMNELLLESEGGGEPEALSFTEIDLVANKLSNKLLNNRKVGGRAKHAAKAEGLS